MSTPGSVSARRTVALLAEGVDRNTNAGMEEQTARVALLAEGVDRNSPLP